MHYIQDVKLIKELTKPTPFIHFLAQKAVEMIDDIYWHEKTKDLHPDLFRRQMKEGWWMHVL